DAQLERVRGDDAKEVAIEEAALDGAPLLGKIAAAVGAQAVGEAAIRAAPRRTLTGGAAVATPLPELLSRVAVDQLSRHARSREGNGRDVSPHQADENALGLDARRGSPGSFRAGVLRIPEREQLG